MWHGKKKKRKKEEEDRWPWGGAGLAAGQWGSGPLLGSPSGLLCFLCRAATMGSVGSQRPREASMASTPHGSVVMSFSFDSGHLEEAAAGATQAQGGRTRSIPIFTDSGE